MFFYYVLVFFFFGHVLCWLFAAFGLLTLACVVFNLFVSVYATLPLVFVSSLHMMYYVCIFSIILYYYAYELHVKFQDDGKVRL